MSKAFTATDLALKARFSRKLENDHNLLNQFDKVFTSDAKEWTIGEISAMPAIEE